MKTAVSVRDDFVKAADHTASVMGISRIEHSSKAVDELVSRHSSDHVTERLDSVHDGVDSDPAPGSLPEGLRFLSAPTDETG